MRCSMCVCVCVCLITQNHPFDNMPRWELHNQTERRRLIFLPLQLVVFHGLGSTPLLPSPGRMFVPFAYARLILLMGSLIKCVGGVQLKRGIDKQSPWLSAPVNWISTYPQRTRMLSIFPQKQSDIMPYPTIYPGFIGSPRKTPLRSTGPAKFQQYSASAARCDRVRERLMCEENTLARKLHGAMFSVSDSITDRQIDR